MSPLVIEQSRSAHTAGPSTEMSNGGQRPSNGHTETTQDIRMPIAVVGMSFRGSADATSVENLWNMISEGREGWSKIPRSRWNNDAFYHPDNTRHGTINVQGGHFFAEDLARFDAPFFNMTNAEAAALDPQQRLLLEGTFEAFENAGLALETVTGSNTSCFVGSFSSDYTDMLVRDPDAVPMYQCTNAGQSRAITTNRISYFFDLKGPSVTVDTACSGSLVALHLACQSLRTGDASMAIAAGVNTVMSHEFASTMSMMKFLSPDGRCYTFDERANGYARGEGVGCLILKPLEHALRDHDTIQAVIRGSGSNQDGRTSGITLPSGDAQEALIRQVYASAGLDPLDTEYVEAHGTGTQAGDPIETEALARVFCDGRSSDSPLRIGSIKTNVGHMEGASGVGGVIKAIMMLQKRTLLPNRNFQKLNPRILLDEWKQKVQLDLEPWETPGSHRVSVNSFGYGGSNAHVVIEDAQGYLESHGLQGNFHKVVRDGSRSSLESHSYGSHESAERINGFTNSYQGLTDDIGTQQPANGVVSSHPRLLTISGFDESSCKEQIILLQDYCNSHEKANSDSSIDNLAFTLNERRSNFAWKAAVFGDSFTDIGNALAKAKPVRTAKKPIVGFVFTGQGAQWCGMGKELLDTYPIFSGTIDRIGQYLISLGAPFSVREELTCDPERSKINLALYSQPMCSAVQIALVELLRSWGITPACVTGHSSGEIAAAYTKGALSMEAAMKAAYCRGVVASEMPLLRDGKGAMMAVGMTEAEATPYLEGLSKGRAVIACVNSPSSLTISGDEEAIDELKAKLDEQGAFARKLAVEVAYHSHHMSLVAEAYRSSLADVEPEISNFGEDGADEVEFFSSVTGTKVESEYLGRDYWVSNMVGQVKFAQSVRTLCLESSDGKTRNRKSRRRTGAANKVAVNLLIEIGPHSALGGPVKQILQADEKLKASPIAYASALARKSSAVTTLMQLASTLFMSGHPIDFAAINRPQDPKQPVQCLNDLPPYPWNHSKTYWAEPRVSKVYRNRKFARTDLLGVPDRHASENEPRWRNYIRTQEIPWVRDHKIQSQIIYPAAGYMTMAIEAIKQRVSIQIDRPVAAYTLRDVSIQSAMVLNEQIATEVLVSLWAHDSTSSETMSGWYEFRVASVSESNKWTQHCNGLVAVKYDPASQEDSQWQRQQALDTQRLQGLFEEATRDCTTNVDVAEFYTHLTSLGLEYGESFANMSLAHSTSGRCLAKVTIADTAAHMPMNFEYPFIIHPSTLDSVLHPIFVALSAESKLTSPAIPISIEHVEIGSSVQNEAGSVLEVFVSALHKDRNNIEADITAVNDIAKPNINLSIRGMICRVLDNGDSSASGAETAPVAYKFDWAPDVDLLCQDALTSLCNKPSTPNREHSSEFVDSYRSLAQYLELLGHKNPHQSICEINAAEEAVVILQTLSGKGEKVPRLARYTATASEQSKVDSLSNAFAAWNDLATTKILDVQAELKDQELVPHSYDVVIVPKHDNGKLLSISHSLLKASGRMILFNASPSSDQHTMSKNGWENALRAANLSTSYECDSCSTTEDALFFTAKPEPVTLPIQRTILIIAEEDCPGVCVDSLRQLLEGANLQVEVTNWASATPAGHVCIVLSELTASLLGSPTESDWERIKQMFLKSAGLLWVTRGGAISCPDPISNLAVGFARTARSELGDSKIVTLDLDPEISAIGDRAATTIYELFLQQLLNEQASTDREVEYAERDGTLLIPRVIEDIAVNKTVDMFRGINVPQAKLFHQSHSHLRPAFGSPNVWNTVRFVDQDEPSVLADDYISVEVRAAGLTTRDLKFADSGLGHECSGVVRAIGASVKNFAVGDRVVGITPGSVANVCSDRASAFQQIPDDMSFAVAAASPVAYTTAYYVVNRLAQVALDEKILVHGAGGPDGYAIVDLCRSLGADVFVTVNSETERSILAAEFNIANSRVFYGKDDSVFKAIHRDTSGRGVDVVVNMTGADAEQLRLSWASIAPYGRYINVANGDTRRPARLDMASFVRDASFTSFDFYNLLHDRPKLAERSWYDAMAGVRSGRVKGLAPLITQLSFSELGKALETIDASPATGKIVVTADAGTKVEILSQTPPMRSFDPKAAYMLVGGLGGIGRAIATWMIDNGAQHLVFVNRSGTSRPEARETVELLQSKGATIEVRACDISDEEQVKQMVGALAHESSPIRGVIQASMVLRDDYIDRTSATNYNAVLSPKLSGSWNLHNHLPQDGSLEFFVLLSSISGIIGNATQAAYAAGSTFMDALASYRRSKGLAATSLDLGVVGGIGYLSENTELKENMERQGFHVTMPDTLLALIRTAIEGNATQIVTGFGAWTKDRSLTNLDAPLFAHMRRRFMSANEVSAVNDTAAETLSTLLPACTSFEQAVTLVLKHIVHFLATRLGVADESVDVDKAPPDHGVDSIVAVEVRRWIGKEMGAQVAMLEIVASESLVGLADLIVGKSKFVTVEEVK